MKLGLLVEAEEGLTWARWRRLVSAAEDLEFDSIWISDHLRSPWDAERHGLEAWTALAVAAAQTRRIGLGTLVSPVTFRPAAIVARMAESLDQLSGGRLTVGLGLGWNDVEHAAFGLPFPPAAERARLLDQSIAALRATFGERPLRVLVGGGGRRTLEIVARAADEWNITTSDVEHFSARAVVLDAECANIGRAPRSIERSIAVGVLIGGNETELHERSARMQACVPPLAHASVADVPAAARAQGWVAGTPSEVLCALRNLGAAGVQRAMLGLYDLDDVRGLEILAEQVLGKI